MSDHYSDCTFSGDEIPKLLSEIIAVSNAMAATSPHQEWLKQFRNACHSAIANGESLFAICD